MITVKMGVSRLTLAVHDGKGRISSILVRKTPHEVLSPDGWENHLSLPVWFGDIKAPVAMASVVPQYDTALQKALVASGKKWMIPLTLPDWGLTVRYSPQGALGVDRLAVCTGARERFPELNRQGWVVADFGTHTVLTVVINNTIRGGSISPGIMTQLQSIGGGLSSADTPCDIQRGRWVRIRLNACHPGLFWVPSGVLKACSGRWRPRWVSSWPWF